MNKLLQRVRDKLIGAYVGLLSGANSLQLQADMTEEFRLRAQDAELRAYEAEDRKSAGVSGGANLDNLAIAATGLQESILGDQSIERTKEAAGLAEIELALEDTSWRDLSSPYGSNNFSRIALRRMMALSRVMYILNPLIRRAVTVQELYVWGSGCTLKAEDKNVQGVIDAFFKDRKNQQVIGASWQEREREQRIDGNTFFMFFINRNNGTSRVRLLPVDQVDTVICNPDDSKEPWYYKRSTYSTDVLDPENLSQDILYPDIDFNPPMGQYPSEYGGIPIKWDARILHVKTGGLSSMKFGMPELFSALNWATAYKKILENFATILAAYARVAMQLKNNKGARGIAASKTKLGTGINGVGGQIVDNNPPTNTASMFLSSGNLELSAIKTAHSTTGPDEARALRSMVAAGSDTPEHFFGDSDIGNFATSTTLDRPTELKMVSRQALWCGVIDHICEKLVEWSATYQNGTLRNKGWRTERVKDPFDGTTLFEVIPPKGVDRSVVTTFPSILERDVVQRVRAVVQAATLAGSKAEGIIPSRKLLFKWLAVALGDKTADKLTDEMYPADVRQGFVDPAKELEIKKIQAEKPQAAPSGGPNTST